METKQLKSTPGFVIYDVPEADNYVGPTRLGSKLIPGNAVMLARHQTYVFATLGMRRSGATIGLKSDPADTDVAVAALADELADEFASQRLLTAPGLRLDAAALAPILAHDQRNPISGDDRDGVSFGAELLGVGAVTAAAAALASRATSGADGTSSGGTGGLDGKRVAIEGFGPEGLAIAREVAAQGGSVVCVGTTKGCVSGDFSPAVLAEALSLGGGADSGVGNSASNRDESDGKLLTALADSHGGTRGKPWQLWSGGGTDNRGEGNANGGNGGESNDAIDVIFCGSKPGAMNGEGAQLATVAAKVVVAWSAAAISSKALAVLRSGETIAVADFVSAVGPTLSWWADPGTTHDQLRMQTSEAVTAVMDETADHSSGHFLAACQRAERFMESWLDELPFGRPLG